MDAGHIQELRDRLPVMTRRPRDWHAPSRDDLIAHSIREAADLLGWDVQPSYHGGVFVEMGQTGLNAATGLADWSDASIYESDTGNPVEDGPDHPFWTDAGDEYGDRLAPEAFGPRMMRALLDWLEAYGSHRTASLRHIMTPWVELRVQPNGDLRLSFDWHDSYAETRDEDGALCPDVGGLSGDVYAAFIAWTRKMPNVFIIRKGEGERE